jgi:hypothetical protein
MSRNSIISICRTPNNGKPRVAKPPGGESSIIFGDESDTVSTGSNVKHMEPLASGAPGSTAAVASSDASSRSGEKNDRPGSDQYDAETNRPSEGNRDEEKQPDSDDVKLGSTTDLQSEPEGFYVTHQKLHDCASEGMTKLVQQESITKQQSEPSVPKLSSGKVTAPPSSVQASTAVLELPSAAAIRASSEAGTWSMSFPGNCSEKFIPHKKTQQPPGGRSAGLW